MTRKLKIINASLSLTSLFAYLEWGKNNHAYLFEAEREVIGQLIQAPSEILHPFIIIPLIGQILLLSTLVPKHPGARLSVIGMGCIGILIMFIFFIGIIAQHWYTVFSTLPFLSFAFMQMRLLRRKSEA